MITSSFFVISFLMLATTKVCASKMRSLSEVMVANVTPTCPAKNSLIASSEGAVPGGEMAKASCAKDLTLLLTIASTSSWLSPALIARCFRASVEYTSDAASRSGTAIALMSAEVRSKIKLLISLRHNLVAKD